MEQIGIKKKPQSIVESLQQAILSGSIPAGTEMTQNDLALSLGVSRMPVREALLALEYAGLVERLPNHHVKVVEMTRSGLEDLFRLLTALEEEECLKREQSSGEAGEASSGAPKEILAAGSGRVLPEMAAFGNAIPDELQWHRLLAARQTSPFLKKTQETLTETYVAFALRQFSETAEKRRELFGRLTGSLADWEKTGRNQQEIHGLFEEYSRLLAMDIRLALTGTE